MTLVFFQILVQTVKRENCIYFFDVFSLDYNIKKINGTDVYILVTSASSCVYLHCNLHVGGSLRTQGRF